jgi:phage baseplate assembly protein V
MSFDLADLQRRLANLIRVGVVAELDAAAARVRVSVGAITTDWLPWLTARAGADRTYWAPEPGEQILLLAPSGELAQAVVLPAIYQSAHPAPADAQTIHRTVYSDGTVVEYDRAAHKLTAAVKGSAEISTDTALAASVGTDASVTAGGNIKAAAGGSLDATAATAVNISAPAINLTGAVTIAGPLSAKPGAAGGGASVEGSMTVTSGDVKADGISLKGHTHSGDSGGTTGPAQ